MGEILSFNWGVFWALLAAFFVRWIAQMIQRDMKERYD